jgi:hypothetical protein
VNSKLAVRIAGAAGVCAAVALTAAPASASTATLAAQPLATHTAGPFTSASSCAVSEGAAAAGGEDIVRDCFRETVSTTLGSKFEWFYQYTAFF